MNEDRPGDESPLERRARWLVRAYPVAYRADRGEEVIGTLLEATPPGWNRPPAREAASVITAGLRARRKANLRQGLSVSLRQAAILGAAMYLVQLPSEALDIAVRGAREGFISLTSDSFIWFYFLSGALAGLIIAAAWSGRRRLVAAASAGAVSPAAAYIFVSHEWALMVVLAGFAGPACVVFTLFARRTERPPASLLWLPCLPLGVTLAGALTTPHPELVFHSVSRTTLLFPYTSYLSVITVAVAVGWLVTDVRPLAGLVFAFTVARVIYGFAYARSAGAAGPIAVALAITASLALAFAVVWLLRRRTRTTPPTTS